MTPYASKTNEELISLVYNNPNATLLEMEFAFRLENNYADDVHIPPDVGETGVEDLIIGGALRVVNS